MTIANERMKHIVLVHHDEIIMQGIRGKLQEAGFIVEGFTAVQMDDPAKSAMEAVKRMGQNHIPVIVLVDVNANLHHVKADYDDMKMHYPHARIIILDTLNLPRLAQESGGKEMLIRQEVMPFLNGAQQVPTIFLGADPAQEWHFMEDALQAIVARSSGQPGELTRPNPGSGWLATKSLLFHHGFDRGCI